MDTRIAAEVPTAAVSKVPTMATVWLSSHTGNPVPLAFSSFNC